MSPPNNAPSEAPRREVEPHGAASGSVALSELPLSELPLGDEPPRDRQLRTVWWLIAAVVALGAVYVVIR